MEDLRFISGHYPDLLCGLRAIQDSKKFINMRSYGNFEKQALNHLSKATTKPQASS